LVYVLRECDDAEANWREAQQLLKTGFAAV